MGYQESMLFCDNKKELKKLCRVLNSAKSDFENYVNVYAIGKLKESFGFKHPFVKDCHCIFPKGTCFVWWGGERHPYQSGDCIKEHMNNMFSPDYTSWSCFFCEYIGDMHKFTKDIDPKDKGNLQENEFISIVEVPSEHFIKESYISKL